MKSIGFRTGTNKERLKSTNSWMKLCLMKWWRFSGLRNCSASLWIIRSSLFLLSWLFVNQWIYV